MVVRVGLASVLLLLGLPAGAQAGTVELKRPAGPAGPVLVYAGGAEPNDVRIWITPETINEEPVWVRDSAGATPGPGCTRAAGDATLVMCDRAWGEFFVVVDAGLGGGDDSAVVEGSWFSRVRLSGGPGGDTLQGSPSGANFFVGGPGDDRMTGGREEDVFDEGERPSGSDHMLGGPDRPTFDGVSFDVARDWVDYSGRSGPVRADLEGNRDDGERAERDRIAADVDGLLGGRGADALAGGGGRDMLFGGPGPDVLRGRRGNDVLVGSSPIPSTPRTVSDRARDRLYGGAGGDGLHAGGGADVLLPGPGADRLSAGPGSDRVLARDVAVDRVMCGRGRDRLVQDPFDFQTGCESHLPQGEAAVPLALGADLGREGPWYAVIEVACPKRDARGCAGVVRLEAGAEPVASGPFDTEGARRAEFVATISDAMADMVLRHDPRVLVTVVTRTPGRDPAVRMPASSVPSSETFLFGPPAFE